MKNMIPIVILIIAFNAYSQSEPSWINNYPFDSRYYTGIGTSDTGRKSDDYGKALLQARLNLAAEISTNIKAETEMTTSDSTRGGLSESFSEKVNQSVEQNLKEIEIVDTHYSPSQGYWVYIRLSKIRWQEIQESDMTQLAARIRQIINEEYFSDRTTTADKFFKLSTAATLLFDSPYSSILESEMGEFYRGNVLDFLQSEVYSKSSEITLHINKDALVIEAGESADFTITCNTADNYIGKIPVTLKRGTSNLTTVYTDVNGNIPIRMESSILAKGLNSVEVYINPLNLGFPDNVSFLESFTVQSTGIAVTVESPSLFLSINTNKRDLNFLNSAVTSLFTKGNEQFQLSDEKNSSSYELIVTLNFTDYPRVLENAPLMSGLDCVISLKRDDRVLYEYKKDTIKDGGLSFEQAYARVFNKLIRHLEDDRSYIIEIQSQFD